MQCSQIVVPVAENDPLLRIDLIDELREADVHILESAKTYQALNLLRKSANMDVLFTEIEMPGQFDGLMLAALVKEQRLPTKVILTSAHVEQANRMGSVEAQVISEPYRPEAVVASHSQAHSLMQPRSA